MKNVIFVDGFIAALMYFALIEGNEYASNLFWPVFWLFVFMSFIVLISLSSEELKAIILKNRKPNPAWKEKYSQVYDVSFSATLAILGFQWSAACWFIVSAITGCLIRDADKKIREDLAKESHD